MTIHRRSFPPALAVLCAWGPAWLAAADDPVPPWLRDVAAQTVPLQGPKVPAVVLLHEQGTTVQEDGLVIERRIKAVKILNSEGRGEAVAAESYIHAEAKFAKGRNRLS